MKKKDLAIYKKLIDIGQITKPSYKTWFSRTFWTPFDAACLFNGVDPDFSFRIEIYHHNNMEITTKEVRFYNFEEATKKYEFNHDELIDANFFLKNILEEARAIDTWKTSLHPLDLINMYIQKIGDVPRELLELATETFLELYQKRNDNNKNKTYWNDNWHDNIAPPLLQLIADKGICLKEEESNQSKPNQLPKKKHHSKQNDEEEKEKEKEEKEKIKILLEESAEARKERVRNRGYEIHKNLKEKYPNKKITKEIIAKYIMKEEGPLYDSLSKENPDKKQPAFGTYIKELRKVR